MNERLTLLGVLWERQQVACRSDGGTFSRGETTSCPDGTILERSDERFVMWHEDGVVEAAELDGATGAGIQALQGEVLALLRLGVLQPARLVEALVASGYSDLGMRRYDFRSGAMYQYAQVQLALGCEAAARRQEILEANGGLHPPLESPDWRPWQEAVMTMNASALAARLLGTAALEGLTNEILAVMFPAVYEQVEKGKPWGFFAKLRKLCRTAGIPEDPPWLLELEQHAALRRNIAHHHPGYVDDFEEPNSVEPSAVNSPEGAAGFLTMIDQAFEGIFALFGFQVPATHKWAQYD